MRLFDKLHCVIVSESPRYHVSHDVAVKITESVSEIITVLRSVFGFWWDIRRYDWNVKNASK